MSRLQHGFLVALLMAAAGVLLVWKSTNTAILFADGLRYIRQAQRIDAGQLESGLLGAIDHPAYPLAIASAHRVEGGEGPEPWQRAAQLASVIAGVLLVVPLYLVSLELLGGRIAWMACVMAYLTPALANVLSDVLSEGTFLLFWTWGLWAALRFFKDGRFSWLAPMIVFSALAYLTRPEGLLLPLAVVATLLLMPLIRSTRLNWPRWWAAVGMLVVGPALVVGPYVAYKGGLGTKPAIARLIGTAEPSGRDAVERNRPLEEGRSPLRAYASASKYVFEAIRDAATIPALLLVPAGFVAAWRRGMNARARLFLGVLLLASVAGLLRLHETGGYCSPRHALIPALLLIAFAALGLDALLRTVVLPARVFGGGGAGGRARLGPIFWPAAIALLAVPSWPRLARPLNGELVAYRLAAEWLGERVGPGETVVDVTGWTLFYGQHGGYTFADLIYAGADQSARWVVAREAHVRGPWEYCRQIRSLVGIATPHEPGFSAVEPEAILPEDPAPGQARVFIYDRRIEGQAVLNGTPEGTVLR